MTLAALGNLENSLGAIKSHQGLRADVYEFDTALDETPDNIPTITPRMVRWKYNVCGWDQRQKLVCMRYPFGRACVWAPLCPPPRPTSHPTWVQMQMIGIGSSTKVKKCNLNTCKWLDSYPMKLRSLHRSQPWAYYRSMPHGTLGNYDWKGLIPTNFESE